jgi:hypothetical protein
MDPRIRIHAKMSWIRNTALRALGRTIYIMLLYQVKQLASTYSRSNSNLSLKGKQQQQQQQLQQQQEDNSLEFKKMKNGLLNTQVKSRDQSFFKKN